MKYILYNKIVLDVSWGTKIISAYVLLVKKKGLYKCRAGNELFWVMASRKNSSYFLHQ